MRCARRERTIGVTVIGTERQSTRK